MKENVSGCSVEEAMRVLGGRWRLLIVSFLLDGPQRFNHLRRVLPGISQRMLTLDLRALEAHGLVLRTLYFESPPRVEYSLTADGERLRPVIHALQQFGLWSKARAENADAVPDAAEEKIAAVG